VTKRAIAAFGALNGWYRQVMGIGFNVEDIGRKNRDTGHLVCTDTLMWDHPIWL
jgi:hypothetical protein